MAKVIDITDKLSFNENPRLKMNDIEVEVNASAECMLRIMGAFNNKDELQAISEALDFLFSKKDKEKICSLKQNGKKLDSKALMVIINTAISLVTGDSEGEA